jgi:hypothetical protein
MKKLFLPLFFVSSFAFGQKVYNNTSYPIMLNNKVDTLNKKVNLAGLYLEKCANYQEKSITTALLGMTLSPLIAYVGARNNNKHIVNLSYAIGITFGFTSLHYKFKSIESMREASKHLPYQSYKPLN